MDRATKLLFEQTLREHSQSITKTRAAIFALLLGHEPQSLHELYRRGSGQFDRASLYRTIKLFEQIGVTQRVHLGWKYKVELTDTFSSHHHHITCLSCGRIIPIEEDAAIEQLLSRLARSHGVTPTHHQLEIQGICDACQKLSAS